MPDGLDMSHEDIQRTLQANLPLKAAKGEVEVDWEKGVRHHIWAVSWKKVNGSTI